MLTKKDYNRAIFEIINECLPFEDVVGVYQFGKIRKPGLSDIDIMVAFSDEPKNVQIGADFAELRLEAKFADYFMGGNVICVPDSALDKIQILDNISLTPLYGRALSKKLAAPEFAICRVMDWLPERVFRIDQLSRQDCSDVKVFYGLMRSFKQTLDDMERFGVKVPFLASDDFENTVRSFTEETAFNLLRDAYHTGLEALASWSEFLVRSTKYLPPQNLKEGYLSIPNGPAFKHNFPLELALEVPPIWFTHWSVYAGQKGLISQRIKEDILILANDTGHVHFTIKDALVERISLINFMAEYLRRYKFSRGLFKFGWYL